MTPFSLVYPLHVLAALVWVGGMFFAWMVLRPAAVKALDGPARLTLWVEVFQGFFRWVWVAVILLPISGVGMLHLQHIGFETAPKYVQVMMGLYVVMTALFIRIQGLMLPELRKAVEAKDWPAGAAVLGRIRRVVGINLLSGWCWWRLPPLDRCSERLKTNTFCGEGACSRGAAQQPHISWRVQSDETRYLGWGRYAAQREQAPSPQW